MGVKRAITLQEAQKLFPKFTLKNLQVTKDGIIDTTYLFDKYILKYYERDIEEKLEEDTYRLQLFKEAHLHVTSLLASHKNWYLYERLEGKSPRTIGYYHIQALARFIAKLHSQRVPTQEKFIEQYQVKEKLHALKSISYYYYKRLLPLRDFQENFDGFIHGDIFKDNTVFDGEKIAVFDFIDGGLGSYAFDIAVALLSFNPKNKYSLNRLFLSTYNQHAPKKIALKTLHKHKEVASLFYALLRISDGQTIARAKELL